MPFYRVWQGDSNDRSELTSGLIRGKDGCLEAKDIDEATEEVYAEYIGSKYAHLWTDSGIGDETYVVLDYEPTEEDCRECKLANGLDKDDCCDMLDCPMTAYISIELYEEE